MISATEARKLTEQTLKSRIIDYCEPQIKEAIAQGKYEVKVHGFFNAEETKILKELGYNLDENDPGGWTEISW